jgi:hypothetical protein
MKTTLTISDLSASKELDCKAMSAVRGGNADQANVGNGLVVGANSPVIIQSDNTFSQDAHNSSTATNDKAFSLGLLLSRF